LLIVKEGMVLVNTLVFSNINALMFVFMAWMEACCCCCFDVRFYGMDGGLLLLLLFFCFCASWHEVNFGELGRWGDVWRKIEIFPSKKFRVKKIKIKSVENVGVPTYLHITLSSSLSRSIVH
jgi:hypothetical protein